jgi:hypothetical protein
LPKLRIDSLGNLRSRQFSVPFIQAQAKHDGTGLPCKAVDVSPCRFSVQSLQFWTIHIGANYCLPVCPDLEKVANSEFHPKNMDLLLKIK